MSISRNNRTRFLNAATVQRDWYVIDASGMVLGRLACEIARILTGKRKPDYTPHCDSGDFVVVVNASKISYTGRQKGLQTKYYRHSGYQGHLHVETLRDLLERRPEQVIINAVSRMLPKGTNRRAALLKKLKVYADAEHPHAAQSPKPITSLAAV